MNLRTLTRDPVDVGRFADHHSLMVGTHLHQADVVTHDEEDVGLLLRLLLLLLLLQLLLLLLLLRLLPLLRACRRHNAKQRE